MHDNTYAIVQDTEERMEVAKIEKAEAEEKLQNLTNPITSCRRKIHVAHRTVNKDKHAALEAKIDEINQ